MGSRTRSCPATGGSQAGSAAREASADQVPAPYGPASSVRSEGVDGTLRGVGPQGGYTHPARETTLLDCLNEVQHMEERVKRLEQSIVEVIQLAPVPIQNVVRGLQALRGIAHISAVTIAVELGNITSRFERARDLMGYSGVFPSEDSSGERIRRGGITKSGNAHLRRIVVESAWSYRYRPAIGARLRKRQEGLPAEITEIAWKAQNRLHKRYKQKTAYEMYR